MSKPISKITVRCPHCEAEQLEPELAKSTFCRRCSEHFAITPGGSVHSSAPAPAWTSRQPGLGYLVPSRREPSEKPAPASGLKQRFGDLIGAKPKPRVAQCFECSGSHEVSSTATSSTCKACGAYIDLQDYKVNGSFSRNIKTRGTIFVGTKGDLSSSKIICSEAVLHGKMRGNLYCEGPVTIRVEGKLFGSIEAGPVIVEKGSDVQFARPLKAASLEVHGRMSGHVASGSHIIISRSGSLEGDVTATGFTVEKGGLYQGELTIIPRQTTESLPAPAASAPDEPAESPFGSTLLGGEPNLAHG